MTTTKAIAAVVAACKEKKRHLESTLSLAGTGGVNNLSREEEIKGLDRKDRCPTVESFVAQRSGLLKLD